MYALFLFVSFYGSCETELPKTSILLSSLDLWNSIEKLFLQFEKVTFHSLIIWMNIVFVCLELLYYYILCKVKL